MKLLRIKDNSQQKKDVFSQVAKLTGKIADKTLEQLEREGVFVFPETVKDAEDITQDQMILQSVNDAYRSGNVMGFLGYGDERLVIESRFCGEGEDFFFQYLLDKVLDFPNVVDLESNANQDNRLFNFLLFLFPYYLKTAMRKGLFKKYIRCRYNDGNVKGTIDVARHAEDSLRHRGRLYGRHLRKGVETVARKRKAGDGTVRQRKDERWEGRIVIGYDDNGYPKTKNVLAKTKKECIEKLQ